MDDVRNAVQSLVSSYLSHNGFVESAKAFSQDVDIEERALSNDANGKSKMITEDMDAMNRQGMRDQITLVL